MKRLLRTATLIVLAMLGSALLLAGLINLTTKLTIYAKVPADFLAANETVALLHHPDEELLRRWSQIYPVLQTLPAKSYDAVAVVERDDLMAIGFTLSKESVPNLIGPFAVTSTHPGGASFDSTAQTLSGSPAYASLAKQFIGKGAWTYVRLPDMRKQSIAISVLKAFVAGDNDVAAVELRDNTLILTSLENRREQRRFSMADTAPDDAALSLHMTNGNASFNELLSHLSQDNQAIVEGLTRGMLHTYGDELSLEYDLLNLLQQPSSLHITATGAQIGTLLSGEHRNTKELNAIIDHFHTAFANTLPATKVTKRVLDTRFSSVDIRHDESMIDNWQRQVDGWFTRGTAHKEMRSGLYTAVNINRFRISNLPELVETHASSEDAVQQNTGGLQLLSLTLDGDRAKKVLDAISTSSLLPSTWYKQKLTVRSFLGNGVKTVEFDGDDNPLTLIESLFF